MKEFYVALPGEMTKGSEVIGSVRGLKFEFSSAAINQFLDLSPPQGDEIDADETMNAVSNEELAEFLIEGTRGLKNLTTKFLSPCKDALVILSAYNWVQSSHKNAVSVHRARLIYKMFHGIRKDVKEMIYYQVLNLGVIRKEGGKKDTRWLLFPRTIYGVLQSQKSVAKKTKEEAHIYDPLQEGSTSW